VGQLVRRLVSMIPPEASSSDAVTAAVWVWIQDRRLLVVRPHNVDVWFLPGGVPESGESLAEAAAREVDEETGVTIDAGRLRELIRVTASAWGRPGRVNLVCFVGDPEPVQQPVPLGEIAEIGWIASDGRRYCAPAIQILVDHLKQQKMIS